MKTKSSLRSHRVVLKKPRRPAEFPSQVNVHTAKTQLSRLLARVEKGEHITIARDGIAVAVLSAPAAAKHPIVSPDDPLLNLASHGFDGPGGVLTNQDIDRIVYGA